MRALVFGGHGFLGRHAVHALTEAGWDARPAPCRDRFDLTRVQEHEIVGLLRAEQPAAVVNATGEFKGTRAELERGNAESVRRLLVALGRGAPGIRLVHLGSLAEYGPGSGRPFQESDRADPSTDYGASKLAAAEAVLRSSEAGAVDGVVLRVANPVGAGQSPFTVLGSVVAALRRDPHGEVRVGPLGALRDFVAAADVGSAVVRACEVVALPQRVLNIGSGRARLVRDVVAHLVELAGGAGLVEDAGRDGSGRSGTVSVAVPDVRRAEQFLGWSATTPLEQALEALVLGAGLNVRVA